jgi:hypothetical protein
MPAEALLGYYHAKGKLSGYVPLEQQANGNQGQGET